MCHFINLLQRFTRAAFLFNLCNRPFAGGGHVTQDTVNKFSFIKKVSRNRKIRLTLVKRQSLAIDLKYIKNDEQQKIEYFLRICMHDWRASLALRYHFHIHFLRKILILYSLSFLMYLTLRLEIMPSNYC